MKVRGVFDLSWSRSSVRLLGALAVGLVFQSSFADDTSASHKAQTSVPASVAAKFPGSVKAKLGGAIAQHDSAREKEIKVRLAEQHQAFMENVGQWNSNVRYRAQAKGLQAWLTKSGITFDFFKPGQKDGKKGYLGQVVKMEFQGTAGASSAVGLSPLPNTEHIVAKKFAKQAVANRYKAILSKDLYAGVDLKTYYSGSNVRYDLIVHPGADPKAISMSFKGANSVQASGNKLVLGTQLGSIAQGNLYAYQTEGSKKVGVPASFTVDGDKVAFNLGAYDHSKSLIIDPVIYGSYFGGNLDWDEVHAIVSDTTGGVYVTGMTLSSDFPITAGPYFTSLKGTQNGFMTQFEGDAYNVDYSVLFGGSNVDDPEFIQIDPYNNIWVTGTTTSPDFPGNPTGNTTSPSNSDIFLMRFQKSVSKILDPVTNPVTVVIGGSASETIAGLAVVPVPNAPASGPTTILLAGSPQGSAIPQVPGSYTSQNAFLLSYTYQPGSGLLQNTTQSFYIGENINFPVTVSGLATDTSGSAYITGSVGISGQNVDTSTTANVFTTTLGVFAGDSPLVANGRLLQGVDLFVRKYSSAGVLIYSGLLGGADDESSGGVDIGPDGTTYTSGSCIAVDSSDNAYIVGISPSFDYPRSRGSYGESWADGLSHVVVTKISATASNVLYSTNLKDTFAAGYIFPSGIAIDGFGQAYITGNLFPQGLTFPGPPSDPDSPNGYVGGQPTIQTGAAGSDAPISTAWTFPAQPQITGMGCYLNVIDGTGSTLVYGTYLSGTLDTKIFGPYVDSYSDLWVFGWTSGVRTYTVNGSTTSAPIPPYYDTSQLPTGLITSKAYKNTDVNDKVQLLNWAFWDPNDPYNPGVLPIYESRDGWLAKIRVGRPILTGVNLGQTIVPGGLGYQTTVTVTLSGPAPAQGAQIVLTIDNTNAASFSSSSSSGSTTVIIPAGQTTTSAIPIYSLPVTGITPVNIKASYDGNFLVSALNVVPWLQNLSLNPTSVVGGNAVTGTITLSFPAPAAGVPVSVNSSSSLLTFPTGNTVTVPGGQTSTTFTIGTVGVDNITTVSATGTVLSVTDTAALQLAPSSILSIVVAPTAVSGLSSLAGTVTLTGLPGSLFPTVAVTVTDTSGNPLSTYTVTPSQLSFSGSANTATFTIQTPYEASTVSRVATATMSAVAGTGYASQTASTVFTVDPSALLNLSIDNLSPNPGDTINATVTLGTPADSGGAPVTLTSSNSAVIAIPAGTSPIVVPGGSTVGTASLPVTGVATTAVTPVTITATRGSVSSSVTVNVQPSTMTLSVTDVNGNAITSILGGNNVYATVTLSAPAPAGGLAVTLNSSPTGLATTGTVTIPAGATSASFTIAIGQVATSTTLNISAVAGGTNGITSNVVTITVTAAGLQGVSFIPSSVRGGHMTTGKVILTGPAPTGGTLITLTASNTSLFPNPVLVTVPAGQTYTSFTLFCPRVSRALAISWTGTDPSSNLASAVLTILR